MLGCYLFVIGLLVLMHENYIIENDSNAIKTFTETIDQISLAFSNIMSNRLPDIIGGGMVGCVFSVLFATLFSYKGMQIVAWTFIIIGICLFTGFSIVDFIKEKAKAAKDHLPKKSNREVEGEKKPIITGNEEPFEPKEEEKKIIISSIDELTKVKTKDEKEEEESEEKENVPVAAVTHNANYTLPPITLLDSPKKNKNTMNQGQIEKNIETLEEVLKDFGVIGKVVEVHIGPAVTQYELELQTGTKISKLLSLHREISLALAKKDVRIEAPIPGKNTVGIELPNDETSPVSFREVLEKVPSSKASSKLLCPLGKNIMGNVVWCEIDKTPHLLVAGATGSGKSVCINGIIASILMRTKPDEVKLVMVDPKKLNFRFIMAFPI